MKKKKLFLSDYQRNMALMLLLVKRNIGEREREERESWLRLGTKMFFGIEKYPTGKCVKRERERGEREIVGLCWCLWEGPTNLESQWEIYYTYANIYIIYLQEL